MIYRYNICHRTNVANRTVFHGGTGGVHRTDSKGNNGQILERHVAYVAVPVSGNQTEILEAYLLHRGRELSII
jgi:hypothetical protein